MLAFSACFAFIELKHLLLPAMKKGQDSICMG